MFILSSLALAALAATDNAVFSCGWPSGHSHNAASKGFPGGAYICFQNKSGPWPKSTSWHARAVLWVLSAVTSPCIYCTWGESERPWVREPDSAILTHLLFPYILDRSTYMQILKNKCYGTTQSTDFPGGSDGKESTFSAGDPGLIPGSGRASGEGNSNPLQYSCLENPQNRGASGYSPWGHKESDTIERITHLICRWLDPPMWHCGYGRPTIKIHTDFRKDINLNFVI